jgi:ribonuclease P protein component
MLSKKNRLNKATVDQIFKTGRFFNSPNLTFKYISIKDQKNSTFSFITPKTSSKSAVKRNLLRRRGYAVLKNKISSLPAGITGVFLFDKKSLALFGGLKKKNYNPNLNLETEIDIILNKLKK